MATECVWRFPHLYGIGTSHRNADVVVHPPEFMIGQAPHCSLILRHDIVTGLHCIIKYEEARWFITDFSFEGTYVNGNKITRGVAVPLDEGFVIKLGPYHNFIYVFSFRDKVDLEPVLSRLALRMQGGEGSNIFGPVCIPTSQESTIPVNRSEHQPNIPQNASQVNSGILPKTAGPSSSTNGSCPSGTASTTRADPRLHDPSGNKRAPEQNMTFNHENQSSSSNGPSSVSGESGVKKRRYSYVNSAGNNVTHEVEERNGSFTEVTMETGASGSFSSKNTFYTPKNCSPGSSSGPSGSARHVNHPTIQNDRLSGVSNKVPPSTNATVETNLRKEIVELHKRIIQYQAKDSHLVRVNHELLSQLQETRLIYERKLQTIEETKHNTGPQSSQASSSAGLIDGAGNGLNPNLSSETPSFAANHSMAEEVTGMENGQQTRNGTPELDSVKEELNRMKAEHAVTEKELNRMKAEHAVTEKELNRMKAEHAVTEKELNRMKAEHAVTEKERNRMKAEHAVTEKELNRMKAEHAVTEKELNRMKAEHAVTEKELTETKELKNSLSIQLQERDEHVKELKKEILELNEVKECLNSCLKSSEEKLENVYSLVENDMACSICNEIFVTPITLNCCHTFCEFCIVEWKKKKHDCPMCRTPIVTQSRSIPMEHFIDKITETKEDIKRHRLELISLRESASEETNVEGDNESEIQELPFTDESNSGDDIRTGVAPTGVVPQPEVFPQAGFIEGVLISQEMVYIPW